MRWLQAILSHATACPHPRRPLHVDHVPPGHNEVPTRFSTGTPGALRAPHAGIPALARSLPWASHLWRAATPPGLPQQQRGQRLHTIAAVSSMPSPVARCLHCSEEIAPHHTCHHCCRYMRVHGMQALRCVVMARRLLSCCRHTRPKETFPSGTGRDHTTAASRTTHLRSHTACTSAHPENSTKLQWT